MKKPYVAPELPWSKENQPEVNFIELPVKISKERLSDFLTLLDDEYKLVKVSLEGDETILRFEK